MMNVFRRVRSHRLWPTRLGSYCYSLYRSFDPVSGAYRGRDTADQSIPSNRRLPQRLDARM